MKQRIANIIRFLQIRTELVSNQAVPPDQKLCMFYPLLATMAINTEEAIKCHENRRSPLSFMSRARPRIHLSQCPYGVHTTILQKLSLTYYTHNLVSVMEESYPG